MNIRVHLPTTEEGWAMLNDRITDFQAEFIINEINKLPYSYEDKIEILEGVRKRIEDGDI